MSPVILTDDHFRSLINVPSRRNLGWGRQPCADGDIYLQTSAGSIT